MTVVGEFLTTPIVGEFSNGSRIVAVNSSATIDVQTGGPVDGGAPDTEFDTTPPVDGGTP